MKITLACLCNESNESSLNFTVFMLRSQTELLKLQNTAIRILFYSDVNKAMSDFYESGDDVILMLNTMLGFDPEFLTEMIQSIELFVTGVYPLTSIDWEMIKTKVGSGAPEDVKHMGLTYNIPTDQVRMWGSHVIVKSLKEFKCVRIHRDVFRTILSKHSSSIKYTEGSKLQYRFMFSDIRDGKYLSPEENFCSMWCGDIHAKTKHAPTNFGSFDFIGSVGRRHILR